MAVAARPLRSNAGVHVQGADDALAQGMGSGRDAPRRPWATRKTDTFTGATKFGVVTAGPASAVHSGYSQQRLCVAWPCVEACTKEAQRLPFATRQRAMLPRNVHGCCSGYPVTNYPSFLKQPLVSL
jgi:hypothetical protein